MAEGDGSNDPGTTAIRLHTNQRSARMTRGKGLCESLSPCSGTPLASRRGGARSAAASAGWPASPGSSASTLGGDSRASAMRSPSRATRSSFSDERPPDWASPEHVALAGAARGRPAASSKPSSVAATASTRCARERARLGRGDEQAQPGHAAAADAAAQLVQLRDAEPVGVEDHHRRRVRHVDADLDDRRRDQHVDVAAPRTPASSASFSSARIRPCSGATRMSAKRGCRDELGQRPGRRRQRARRIGLAVALDRLLAVSSFGDASASIAGHTTNPGGPSATSSARRSQTRGEPAGLLGERHDVASRCRRGRPGIGGSSRRRGRRTPSSRRCAGSAWR